jgi:hypothetical protein
MPVGKEVGMSNGARHVLGLVVGVVITPLTAVALMFGTGQSSKFLAYLAYDRVEQIPACTALVVSAVLLGLASGSRISPLASLVPGAAYALTGLAWVVSPESRVAAEADLLPGTLGRGYLALGGYGIFLMLGFLLLAASLPPSRWRAAAAAGAGPSRRGALPAEPAFGGSSPAFPPPWPAPPVPPASAEAQPQSVPPPSPPSPPSSADNGSWTQVFGGGAGADQGGWAAPGGGPDPSPSQGPSPQ